MGCGPDAMDPNAQAGPSVEAEHVTSKEFGDYVLHFNSMSTDQLQPNIAREYGIVRSKNRALLTVSIIKSEENSPGKSVPGTVTSTANNLTGQVKNLTLKEIREGDAVYYIGDVAVANAEVLVFNVEATPANETDPMQVRFSRRYFTD